MRVIRSRGDPFLFLVHFVAVYFAVAVAKFMCGSATIEIEEKVCIRLSAGKFTWLMRKNCVCMNTLHEPWSMTCGHWCWCNKAKKSRCHHYFAASKTSISETWNFGHVPWNPIWLPSSPQSKPTTSSLFSHFSDCDSLHLVTDKHIVVRAAFTFIKYFYCIWKLHLRTRLMHRSHSITQIHNLFIYLFFHSFLFYFFFTWVIFHARYASTSSAIPIASGHCSHCTSCCFKSIFDWLIKATLPRPHCTWRSMLLMLRNGFPFHYSLLNATKGFYFYSLITQTQLFHLAANVLNIFI